MTLLPTVAIKGPLRKANNSLVTRRHACTQIRGRVIAKIPSYTLFKVFSTIFMDYFVDALRKRGRFVKSYRNSINSFNDATCLTLYGVCSFKTSAKNFSLIPSRRRSALSVTGLRERLMIPSFGR